MSQNHLPKKLHGEITKLCAEGDSFLERKEYEQAIAKYKEAWNLLPEKKLHWEAATWILTSAGDTYFRQGDYAKSLASFVGAVQGPGGLGNPYIHLRLGQNHFELDDMAKAGDELARAYMGAGDEIFKGENAKYSAFLHTILLPPLHDDSASKKKRPKK